MICATARLTFNGMQLNIAMVALGFQKRRETTGEKGHEQRKEKSTSAIDYIIDDGTVTILQDVESNGGIT